MTIELSDDKKELAARDFLSSVFSQCDIIKHVLQDRQPHSAYELARAIAEVKFRNAPCIEHGIRIGARIWDLNKKLKSKGQTIVGKRDKKNPQKYWYQLVDSDIVL